MPESRSASRQDEAAKLLLTSTAVLGGLMGAFGLTSDRIPHLLDDATNAGNYLLAAAILVVLSLWSGIAVLASKKSEQRRSLLLVGGSMCLVAGLSLALTAIAIGFRGNGRPTITEVNIAGERPEISVSFTVHADGVDRNEHMQVVAGVKTLDSHGNEVGEAPPAAYASILRPDDKGIIQQVVKFHITITSNINSLGIRAYRAKDRKKIEGSGDSPIDAVDRDCASKNFRTAPGCVDISLPGTLNTPSPGPT